MRRTAAVLALLFVSATTASADCLNVPWGVGGQRVDTFVLREVAVGDFDGDGDTDIAATAQNSSNQPITRALYLRNNAGELAPPVTVLLGSNLRDIEAVDATNDGRLDLVLADSQARTLVVLPGRGNGAFGTPVRTQVLDTPAELTVADFTGDGDPDIATLTITPPSLTVYANAGNGEFVPLSQVTLPESPVSISDADVDNDGNADVMIGHFQKNTMTVAFGFGDGGFATPVSIASGNWVASAAGVDLDGDGDREVVTANFDDNTIGVHLNDGGRALRAPVKYAAGTDPTALAVADFSGDGRLDVALATLNGDSIISYTSNGNGTLRAGNVGSCQECHLTDLAVADMNRDGRPDLVAGDHQWLAVHINYCGVASLQMTAESSSIAAGSPAVLNVFLSTPLEMRPTGTIVIREGTRNVATIPADTAVNAKVSVDGLTVGDHTFTAHYGGDDDFDAVMSQPLKISVLAQSSAVTLTQTSASSSLGDEHRVSARVTSNGADVATGKLALEVDGARVSEHSAPAFDARTMLSAGTHTLVARYLGDGAHAPAQSAPLTHTVAKASPAVNVLAERNTTAFGQAAPFIVAVERRGAWTPTGTVRLMEGATLVASATLSDLGTATIETTTLARGSHSLRVEYAGDANFNTASSRAIAHEVVSSPKRRGVRH